MMLHIGAFILLKLLMFAFFIVLAVRIIIGFRNHAGHVHRHMMHMPGVQILQKRFARGEISSAEYSERLAVLTKQD